MKPLRTKIQDEANLKKVPIHVIEKDYALSYILAGMAKQPELSHSLIFKGGTALKKIFFGDYRFSEDLDFSVINAPKDKKLENALQNALARSKELLNEYGSFDIQLKRNPEKSPHPKGQDAFNVLVKFPWQPTPLCRIKVEITHDEPVILSPEYKSILHDYDEQIDCTVACYHIEEIVAEKLRALLQTHKKLVVRGWNRPRARDYYDLWCILKNYISSVDTVRLIEMLDKKCVHRDVSYQNIDDFFTVELVKEANQHWQPTLGVLVKGLPGCEEVLNETKQLIAKII
ncbi:MAG TPA: nucleotidyl transferase AbiEii/AbiGii toxin family protein [Gammaproteobacteria bacterium]|nr:nucleotidyl transferase AbiEii/AbiGii toxin family protein [Gammaproteobacteria bacterium]